jgi:hypothetical protein
LLFVVVGWAELSTTRIKSDPGCTLLCINKYYAGF